MAGADRNVFVLGIGGGITTDISGFTASIYKRGVRFAFVPTTLLAQVDAAIGGNRNGGGNGPRNNRNNGRNNEKKNQDSAAQ